MPTPSSPPVPLGDRPRRLWARSRRVSAAAVVATIVALGGAVAGVYTTGVTLGVRIAPSGEDDTSAAAGPEGELGTGVTDGSTSTEGEAESGSSSLPDRAGGSTTSTGSSPSAPGDGSSPVGGSSSGGGDPVEPYPGVWPYVSWDEVAAHSGRDDDRYRTPGDTALRFATEVVGLTGASVGAVDEQGVVATVEIRSGRGSTFVELTGATAGESTAATPWSVVAATGSARLEAPTSVAGATVAVGTSAAPGVVGIHDRTRWRGIGVAPSAGAPFDVRIDPGAGGPGIAVALAGDPRAPASFTARRIQLATGAGSAVAAAPADPVASTRALVEALGRGDVGATWELLDPAARRSVLDWRGLAGRLPALRDQLSAFGGDLTTTNITTPIGTVAVVAPAVRPEGVEAVALSALAFRSDGGARLASTESAAVAWTGPSATDPTVLASGTSRPIALVVDGAVWAATAEGTGGLRASAATLAPGAHLAIAVSVQGEQVTASAFPFIVMAPATPSSDDDDPDPDADPPAAGGTPREAPAILPEGGQ